ncbi:hypothetical protein ACFLUA_00945 [Chloroflexota bacterium]
MRCDVLKQSSFIQLAGGTGFGDLDDLGEVAVGEVRPCWVLLASSEGVKGCNGNTAVIPEWVA